MTTLLQAMAQFLVAEVQPKVAASGDKRLAFRVLIAANLAQIVSQEIATEDGQYRTEMIRLGDLLPAEPVGDLIGVTDHARRRGLLVDLNRELARGLDEGSIDSRVGGQAWRHVRETLRERLSVSNARFDVEDDVDGA
jgi:hypothetical protein